MPLLNTTASRFGSDFVKQNRPTINHKLKKFSSRSKINEMNEMKVVHFSFHNRPKSEYMMQNVKVCKGVLSINSKRSKQKRLSMTSDANYVTLVYFDGQSFFCLFFYNTIRSPWYSKKFSNTFSFY